MFSTIDVMVAQAHIDQLNELADTKHLVKADRHGANSGHAGIPRKSADPQGLRTFCILSRTRGTTPPRRAQPTRRRGACHVRWARPWSPWAAIGDVFQRARRGLPAPWARLCCQWA